MNTKPHVPLLLAALAAPATAQVDYGRDVRPILAENCFACHGPDESTREGGLRLDLADEALGFGAIVPGDADASELIYRVRDAAEHERMPPVEMPKRLSDEEIRVLVEWIDGGADFEEHWAWTPPTRPALPEVAGDGWVRNPIDHFVLARLESEGLTPAPEADRRTLARRLSFDLTGLPPDPAEVEAFVADSAPDAYERLVDRWMARPQWGEHRGRHWLDVARYADTHGIHFDNFREMWSYREWVVDAFNRDLPFDRFTIEQLAGDLLPEPDVEQLVATGFSRCNITTNEGGIIDEEYRVLYARDRTETFGQAWLGLSVGCAACHDHKFDPLTQREFYELTAFFNNTTQRVRDGNAADPPPIVRLPRREDVARLAVLEAGLDAAREGAAARREAARTDFEGWLAAVSPAQLRATVPSEHLVLRAPFVERDEREVLVDVASGPRRVALEGSARWVDGPFGGPGLKTQGTAFVLDDAGDFDHADPFTFAAWVRVSPNDSNGAVVARMDEGNAYRGWDVWVQGRRIGSHVIHRWPENAVKVVANAQLPADRWTHVGVTYDGSGSSAGLRVYYDGVEQETNVEADGLTATTRTDVPFRVGQRHESSSSGAAISDLRLYGSRLTAGELESLARSSFLAEMLALEERTAEQDDQLYRWWLAAVDEESVAWSAEVDRLASEHESTLMRGTVAHVMNERAEPARAHVLFRGEYDQRRDEVGPGTPAFLGGGIDDGDADRLDLARWLLEPDHPLTTRVTVNRFWQEVFGAGLVPTSGDFGISGAAPTHPELLDWLAVEFRESGWGVKDLFRRIVTSSTYRQAAVVDAAKLERDPRNALLSRGPRFRMDAEMVRDTALAASGLLVPTIGGPSVRPYQPDGVWEAVAMRESNTRNYRRDSGDALYRRSLYTFWKRSAPPASMEIFDAPSRELCTVRRERTNTPLQALVTLNDPQFVEAARVLAARALHERDDAAGRADFVMARLAARPLTEGELEIALATVAELTTHYASRPDEAVALLGVGEWPRDEALEPAEHAAWTMLASVLMNADEVLNK